MTDTMLPDGWKYKALGKLVEFAPKVGKLNPTDLITFLGMVDVSEEGRITGGEVKPYSLLGSGFTYFENGDILVAKITPCFENGKGAFVKGLKYGKGFGSTEFHVLRPNGNITNDYLFLHTRTNAFRQRGAANMTGSAGQRRVPRDFLKTWKIPLPPLPEQRKIAAILGTWDRAIETVEALIDNSQAQKKALMQQLLTGKRRLPGFSGEWKSVTLQQVAKIIVSNVDKKSNDDENPVRLCNYMDVYRHDRIHPDMQFMDATASDEQVKKFGLKCDDVIITKDSETPDDIAVPAYIERADENLVCGYHLAIIRAKTGCTGRYLKFYFENPTTQHYFASRANGATRFGLTVGSIEKAPITLPCFDEQKAIAGVLSEQEETLSILTNVLGHLQREKAALMQQLLTGKRRVPISNTTPQPTQETCHA